MSGATVEKARLINLDKGDSIVATCVLNPKEYAFAKQNNWKREPVKGSNVPELTFGGGQPATMTVQLLFDTYTTGGNKAEDVRTAHTNAIWQLMEVLESTKDSKTDKGRPPYVRFHWGKAWTFDAVIKSITQRFTLFLPNGTPVRATLDVTFEQIKDESLYPRQNPTSGGEGGERQWTVREGDSLASIAYAEYGDPGHWRPIADANRLVRVRRLRPGTVLEIPNA